MKTVVLLIFLALTGLVFFLNVEYFCDPHMRYRELQVETPPRADDADKVKEPPKFSVKHSLLELYRQCLLAELNKESDNNIFDALQGMTEHCVKTLNLKESSLIAYRNNDEVKYHIDPNGDKRSDCTIITLGVGHDVSVENALKKMYDSCHFYAADPIEKVNKDLFTPIGKFFPFAVGASNKIHQASVKLDPNSDRYTAVNFTHVELLAFLKEKANIPAGKIDQLLLDAEGAEYELVPYFAVGGPLETAGYDVCQMNTEFHLPDDDKKQIFADFIRKTLSDGQYLPFKIDHGYHMRMFLLNVASEKCVQLYVNDKF